MDGKRGANVDETAFGDKAREAPRRDVVLTDYAMPHMNGLDLAKQTRQIMPALPIVLATGYADLPLHYAPGFLRLAKPYAQDELADILNKAVQRSN